MNKSALLRRVYAELRDTIGPAASSGDVLRLAEIIVRAYTDETSTLVKVTDAVESRAFFRLAVDNAMRDGGWRVLEFELEANFGLDDPSSSDLMNIRKALQKYIGPEWRHPIQTASL